ncbi:MAG: endonuclease III [Bacilli bacterium]|jgi:endonuclease-3|nr:endonuclease III [Bacilli bacterium]
MIQMKSSYLIEELDKLYPDARCELNYNKDYELLIATVLSAQCTDKRVNSVTSILFSKYDINTLSIENEKEIEKIIKPCGSQTKKAYYIKTIAEKLVKDYEGRVPNNREYLESLPGVGRKTCNVVLSNLYDVPAIAVDTHVSRVAIRLGLSSKNDSVLTIEKKLMKKLPKENWSRLHHQLVLFGRYKCKAIKPICQECPFINTCKEKNKNI